MIKAHVTSAIERVDADLEVAFRPAVGLFCLTPISRLFH